MALGDEELQAIFASPDFRNKLAMENIFEQELGREIGQPGREYYTGIMGGGMTPDIMRSQVSGSPEGLAYDISQNPQLAEIYRNRLGRDIGREGLDFYSGRMNEGLSMSDIDRQIMMSPEGQAMMRSRISAGTGTGAGAGGAPQYGLGPAIQSYESGQARNLAGTAEMNRLMGPWGEQGLGAYNLMNAYTGAAGPEAQKEAFANYAESPGQDWYRQQMLRETENWASRTGQVQSGNVLQALQDRAFGLAQTDFQNQQTNLATSAGLGAQMVSSQAGANLASGQFGAGMDVNLGNLRYRAGTDLSGNIGTTTSALANLQKQQGITDANLYGNVITGGANIISGTGQQMAGLGMDVSTMLANMGTQTGTQQAGFLQDQADYLAAGQLGATDAYGNAIGEAFGIFNK